MNCLKCGRELDMCVGGKSTLMQGIEYVMCKSCGNIMIERNGVMVNTPETHSKMTLTMMEDAARALRIPKNTIIGVGGLKGQVENKEKTFEEFVNNLFGDDNSKLPGITEDLVTELIKSTGDKKMITMAEKLKEAGLFDELMSHTSKAVNEGIDFEELDSIAEDLAKKLFFSKQRDELASMAYSLTGGCCVDSELIDGMMDDILSAKSREELQEKAKLRAKSLANKVAEEHGNAMHPIKVEVLHGEDGEEPEISIEGLPEGPMGDIFKNIIDDIVADMNNQENQCEEESCATLETSNDENTEEEVADYLVLFRDGRYTELQNKTKKQIADYINNHTGEAKFKVVKTQPVELKVVAVNKIFEVQ